MWEILSPKNVYHMDDVSKIGRMLSVALLSDSQIETKSDSSWLIEIRILREFS